MIVGLGTDITELARMRQAYSRFGRRFAEKILTPGELSLLPAHPTAFLAGRFAAKEAAAKALGTGFSQGLWFTHLEILPDGLGRPELRLLGPARARAQALNASAAHISLSHGRDAAVAVVILESQP